MTPEEKKLIDEMIKHPSYFSKGTFANRLDHAIGDRESFRETIMALERVRDDAIARLRGIAHNIQKGYVTSVNQVFEEITGFLMEYDGVELEEEE